ncbi:MAG: dihydropteroate synthase [Thermoguttaceae bacterium]
MPVRLGPTARERIDGKRERISNKKERINSKAESVLMSIWSKKTENPLIMGIVNVTPDSFSDGGCFFDPDRAIAHGIALANEGASILDIGGESSRFGANPVLLEEEIRRTIPVITALDDYFSSNNRKEQNEQNTHDIQSKYSTRHAQDTHNTRNTHNTQHTLKGQIGATCPILCIDTTKSQVAEKAIAAGAQIVNDISSLSDDPNMLGVLLKTGAAICLTHRQGTAQTMQLRPTYANDDPVGEVLTYLEEKADFLIRAGVQPDKIAIDPGIGFGKTFQHNLELIRAIRQFRQLGFPVLVGHSRKRFIGDCLGDLDRNRSVGTLALSLFLAKEEVDVLRVHEVAEHHDLFQVWNRLTTDI